MLAKTVLFIYNSKNCRNFVIEFVMKVRFLISMLLLQSILFVGCQQQSSAPDPWGANKDNSTSEKKSSTLQLDDIISNGELIMVTISGPETYYEYHGRGMGLQYLLLQKFCEHIGVSLRVDVCRDTADMVNRIKNGEADVLAMPLNTSYDGLANCISNASGGKWHWLVNNGNTTLADTLNTYFTPSVLKKVQDEEAFYLSSASVTRRIFSPMLNRSKGVISEYDYLFQRYSTMAGWDWRLLAAQCYQESTFDARAVSWAGACGLMQIMPSTAKHLGLELSHIYDPEKNIATACRYIGELTRHFSDVSNPSEKIKFVLASYNGGSNHVRDAMALARKYGDSPYIWNDVQKYILGLQSPEYYKDSVVKSGYMRGSETADYVDRIWARWMDYRGVKGFGKRAQRQSTSSPSFSPSSVVPEPHPSARRKSKYEL